MCVFSRKFFVSNSKNVRQAVKGSRTPEGQCKKEARGGILSKMYPRERPHHTGLAHHQSLACLPAPPVHLQIESWKGERC